MVRPKNQTEDLLPSIIKKCETLIEQIHRKPEESLEFKIINPKETFHFNTPVQKEEDRVIGLIGLEVYNSIFNVTEEDNKFELYRDTFDEFSFTELKDKIEETLNFLDITPYHLQHETI